MNFLKKCSGIDMQGAELNAEALEAVKAVFPEAMAEFKAYMKSMPDFRDYYSHNTMKALGYRCSMRGVTGRLRGFDILGHHAINGSVKEWVLDALRDCSSADYWYEFEKDWD